VERGWLVAAGVASALVAAGCSATQAPDGPQVAALEPLAAEVTLAPASLPPTAPPGSTAPTTTAPPPATSTTVAATTTTTSTTTTTIPWSVGPGSFAAFDQSLAGRLIGNGAYGLSVAVARDGEVVHTAGVGLANAFTGEKVTPQSIFRIASVSKTLLAIAVMQLVDEGVLRLDQPVLDRVADDLGIELGDPSMSAITLQHLLGHVSAIPEYERTFFGGVVGSCADAARRGLAGRLLGQPGTVFRYSNMNYCLLGLVVEQATGRSYVDEVTTRVLEPLGIADMHIASTATIGPGEVLHPTTPGRNFMEALGPAGAWVGTAEDLVRILDSVPTELAKKMARPAAFVPYPEPDRWYGLGMIVFDGGLSFGHTGTLEGARAMVVRRADGITWSVLVNGDAPWVSDRLRSYVGDALATVDWTG
jgi:CubicO group peptidase (beta-lactamase class C family)